jgi:hypothetical protein
MHQMNQLGPSQLHVRPWMPSSIVVTDRQRDHTCPRHEHLNELIALTQALSANQPGFRLTKEHHTNSNSTRGVFLHLWRARIT